MIPIREEIASETTSWSAFKARIGELTDRRWHFRGAIDDWDLEPSLQRTARDWEIPASELPVVEGELLRDFKRSYPANATMPPPNRGDTLGWLALMQHHGAPTRLLDWTYSPFVAAFFALDALLGCRFAPSGRETRRMAAVWALSIEPLASPQDLCESDTAKHAFRGFGNTRNGRFFSDVFCANPPLPFVGCVNPWRLNERLAIQQGLFLCPGDLTLTFEENLRHMPGVLEPQNLRRFLLPASEIYKALADLHRMNINHATLFPGLDGYARRLRHRIKFLHSLQIYKETII